MKSALLILCAAALAISAETPLGKPMKLKSQVAIAKLMDAPDAYVGRTVQVKGTVREVCQTMGCWMVIADADGKAVRIKVKDGEIVFPKSAAGKTVIAEGKFTKLVLTKEQAIATAKHEAEENKKPFDPASITSGMTIYQIAGTGAVILE